MANEKSRNHEPEGGNKGGNGQTQGKPGSDKQGDPKRKRTGASASGKPGPGKQPRDQLTIRANASSPSQKK